MAYRVFTLPVHDPGATETELNGFLASHRVLSVDRRFVEEGERSFWTFCVDFVDARRGSSSSSAAGGTWKRDRTDYREVLNAEDFAVFAKLREIRKAIAQVEGVPVYTIFTNEQLAQLVQARATTKSALEQVVGVGDGRTGPTALPSRRLLRRANRRSWPPGAGSRTRTLRAVGLSLPMTVNRGDVVLVDYRHIDKRWRRCDGAVALLPQPFRCVESLLWDSTQARSSGVSEVVSGSGASCRSVRA
jgi:HRDC domain-containing protein